MGLQRQSYDRALVITHRASAGWAHAQMAEISSALRAIGIDASHLDFEEARKAIHSARPDSVFVVDANNHFACDETVRKFSFMVDHPCQLLKHLTRIDRQPITLGWVDASHVDGLAALGIPVHAVFLPHAGPDPNRNPPLMRERDFDFLFAGGLGEPVERLGWLAQRSNVPGVLADIVFDTAARIETSLDPMLNIFADVCMERGIKIGETFSRDALCMVIGEIFRIAEINRRHAILDALPEAKVCILSDYLPLKLRGRSNIRHLNHTEDFRVIRCLMARSKIVLNTTCKFPRGSHERIWYGMAEGAVVLTDSSLFMQSGFAHGVSILYLPQKNILANDLAYLRALIDSPAKLDAIAQAASEPYARYHTWKQCIHLINEAVQQDPPCLAA